MLFLMIDTENIFFINSKGKRIDFNSHYTEIIEETNGLGIDTSEITIEELMKELDVLLAKKHSHITKDATYLNQLREYIEFHNKIRVLFKSILADAFNLYSWDENKMPIEIQRHYKCKYNNTYSY